MEYDFAILEWKCKMFIAKYIVNSYKCERGGQALFYADIYEKILFILIVCSSFFNVLLTVNMIKKALLFKLLGLAFFIPFTLCCSVFIFSVDTTASLVISLSEFCLSVCIFFLLYLPYNIKSQRLKAAVIVLFSLILTFFTIRSDKFIYYSISVTIRHILIALCIAASIICTKKRNYDPKLRTPLGIWLVSILLGFVENQEYVTEAMLIIKMVAYVAFLYYFYSTIYKLYMDKINELEKLIKTMEQSLHKEVKKRVFEIERSNERLLEISKTDMLTKTFNKITILNIIEKLTNTKKQDPFSILMFDIDNFKTINDSFGHVVGDMCIKLLAGIAFGNIREVDYLGRYGGDEFIIVLPALSENEAKFVAERFRKKISEETNPKFTVSIGIATYPYDGQSVKELISVADKGLYKSKSAGKNCVSHA